MSAPARNRPRVTRAKATPQLAIAGAEPVEKPRNAGDFYPTDPRLCRAICRWLRATIGPVSLVVEPSAGDGPFVVAVEEAFPEAHLVVAVEPNLTARAGEANTWVQRWEDDLALPWHWPSLVVGNPPFDLAERHIAIGLERILHESAKAPEPHWLAFLLRASMLAGEERFSTLYDDAPRPGLFGDTAAPGGLRYVRHLVPRPSFSDDGGTDGAEYVLAVWQAGWHGPYEGGWLKWRGAA
jgi:hypothetical protein